jgi:hypothetical protein
MPKTRWRTAISGVVFFDFTRLISQPRRSGLNLSTFYPADCLPAPQTPNVYWPTEMSVFMGIVFDGCMDFN